MSEAKTLLKEDTQGDGIDNICQDQYHRRIIRISA